MAMLWIVLILVIMPIINGADDISCHYTIEGDALPSAEDASFSPPTDSIFFHETSCRGMLDSRQACSVESTAKTHPRRNVYVLFSGPVTINELYSTNSSLSELKKYYPNIHFMRVHIIEYTKNSTLEEIITKRIHHKSQWQVVHTSDLLRLLTIYKFGGLYLDLDTLVVKPLDNLGTNYVAKENKQQIGNAVINAEKDVLGQEFLKKVLEEVSSTYRPDNYDYNGGNAMLRVLYKFCNTTKFAEFSKDNCQGFEVYTPEYFYLLPFTSFKKFLEPGDLHYGNKTYMFHLSTSHTRGMKVQLDSPFDKLSKQFCPIIRKLHPSW